VTQVVYTKSHVRVESVSRICPPRGISTDCTLHNLERDVTLKVLGPVPGTEFNVMVLFHYTDIHIYVFTLGLVLSVVQNKSQKLVIVCSACLPFGSSPVE
jgi:hypothetical protein